MTVPRVVDYLGRRFLRAALLVFAVSAISFWFFELAPGDYFYDLLLDPRTSPETIEALRTQHGLYDSAAVRYLRWLQSILRGDWGISVAYNSPAGPLLFERARNTLLLTGCAMFCAWAIAVPFAIWVAAGGRWRSFVSGSVVSTLLSLPDLVIALLLVIVASHFRLLPSGGMTSQNVEVMNIWQRIADLMLHLAIPVAALVFAALPTLVLHTRAAVVEALNQPFVRFARANGVPSSRILVRHVLPAAANPLITLLGLSVGSLLSSSLLVEAIAGWPGLGQLLLQALLQRDLMIVAGAVLLSSILLVAGNLMADILLYAVDPGIREVG